MSVAGDTTLLNLLDEVRRKTLDRLDGVTDEQARWTPAGLQNSILWHAGHAYIVSEWMTMGAVGAETTCPPGWFELFSWTSKPARIPADRWPKLADVVHELRVQHGRLRRTLTHLPPELLDQPARDSASVSVRLRILHGYHDEACHSGEIWLLRKLQGAR